MVWVCFVVLQGCFSPSPPEKRGTKRALFEGMDRRTRLRLQSYMANGQRLYDRHCVNCHQANGEGLRQLIPPLRASDYLAGRKEVACIIRHGARHPMKVRGKSYHAFMPPNPKLRDIEIAELMCYIGNAWGNREGFHSVKEVRALLGTCGYSKDTLTAATQKTLSN